MKSVGNNMSDTPFTERFREDKDYFFDEGCYINELLNTAADPQLSVARARVLPGETTRWHKLLGTTERYLIVAGVGSAEVGDEPALELTRGDVLVIPPGVRQRITNTGSEVLEFLALCTPRFEPQAYVDLENAE